VKGVASVSVRPKASTFYQWRYGGSAAAAAAQSPASLVTVDGAVSIATTSSQMAKGIEAFFARESP
jgi:hypothetical protein